MDRIGLFSAVALLILFLPALAGELVVAWPDVEQGACTLIVGPDGSGVLIDAGTSNAEPPDQDIVEWLREVAQTYPDFHLRYIIATHYHQDHICWIDDVVNAGILDSDGVVYDRGSSYSTATFSAYENAVMAFRQSISPGQVIDLGGATLQCLIAAGEVQGSDSITTSDENNLSLGFLLSYADFQLWVGGDLEEDMETLAKDVIGDVDVYVVHHHGSNTSSTLSFLNAIKPEVAVCQVGENTYGHPSIVTTSFILHAQDTDGDPDNGTPMLILQNKGSYFAHYAQVYIADPDGAGAQPGNIELHTDGTSYIITAPGIPEPIMMPTDGAGTPITTPETPAPEEQPPTIFPPPPSGQCTVSVILEGVQLVYNNSVGNDWSLGLEVNGERVQFSRWGLPQTVWTGTVTESTTLTITAIAVEDDKYPDIGRTSTTFSVDCSSLPVQTATLEVLVREDRGRYAGNTALWRFQIMVEVSQ